MHTQILITDIKDEDFFLLDLYRPASEFRYGGFSLRERLTILVGKENIYYFLRDEDKARTIGERYGIPSNEIPSNNFIAISTRVLGSLDEINSLIKFLEKLETNQVLVTDKGGFIGGKFDGEHFPPSNKSKKYMHKTLSRLYMEKPWDFIERQPDIIRDDALNKQLKKEFSVLKPNRGNWPILAHKDGVYIERYTYTDTRHGPIIISSNVEIQSFTRISGPSVIRENTILLSSLIRENTAIGPVCKIGGEVADSLVDGYSNQTHKSYIGHSYVGQWVNIGAFTVTSDLKNTYGEIKFDLLGEKINTNQIKLGAFICDYAKTSISTSIMGGKLIGHFSHVIGPVYKSIPPFTIWNGYTNSLYNLYLDSAVKTQERMYARRKVKQLATERKLIEKLYRDTEKLREGKVNDRFTW